jgi:hypothetical protein
MTEEARETGIQVEEVSPNSLAEQVLDSYRTQLDNVVNSHTAMLDKAKGELAAVIEKSNAEVAALMQELLRQSNPEPEKPKPEVAWVKDHLVLNPEAIKMFDRLFTAINEILPELAKMVKKR